MPRISPNNIPIRILAYSGNRRALLINVNVEIFTLKFLKELTAVKLILKRPEKPVYGTDK